MVEELRRDLAAQWLPRRKVTGHKGDFGKVYVLGGSVGLSGAPVFASEAAQRAGCGLVFLGVPEAIYPIAAVRCSSVMPHPLPTQEGKLAQAAEAEILRRVSACDVLAMGCGAGRSEQSDALQRRLLQAAACPVVLDADGINALAGHIDTLDRRQGRVTVLTPHEGEFLRLVGEYHGERIEQTMAFAKAHGCILVRKGAGTLITDGERIYRNTTGNSGMAKGGSGDVLTGLIAGLLAQGVAPLEAAALAVWLHGYAGDVAAAQWTEYAMTPQELLTSLPQAFQALLS